MYPKFSIVVLLSLLISCEEAAFTPSDGKAVRAAIAEQGAAWNNGDIPGYMFAYDDSACFISRTERTCGKSTVTARYEKRYPDRAAMGRLDFGKLEVLGAGGDHAWCTGTWRLTRSQDTLSGGFSLFWVRTASGWRILRDHTY